ncbi:3'(2'),5'-bisphosphate nucleotidase CysQ [Alkanindiges sp. WGS2144]|uniref:3'(2'),5'-bisphosphate nucleotidase CysQ family protein n=1 Tax=Alkanindiges sp. WGS2144 TaxID=3366808 RepID=UPI003750C9AF
MNKQMIERGLRFDQAVIVQLVELVSTVNQRLCQFYQHYTQNQMLQISNKADKSPVTEADMAAHHLIEQGLLRINPLIPVLSEESSDHELRHDWQEFWLVDPLDGTREFINKTGEFTVNIALIINGQVELALIGIPTLKRIYLTQTNQPVCRVDSVDDKLIWSTIAPQPVDVSHWNIAISRRSEWKVYQQFKQALHERQQAYACNNAGSAYKFCLMLEGQIDVYPRFHPTSEWDTASGQGLLEALGGGLFDLQGKPFKYNQRHDLLNGHFVAVRHRDFLQSALEAAQQAVKASL